MSALALLDLKNPVITITSAELTKPLLKELCAAMLRVDSVTQLELSGNKLGDAGVEILADLISNKPRIVHINLRHNEVGDVGLALLCRALARHNTVKSLNVSGNPVSDIGLAELAKFVMSSTDLETLDLMDTPISLRGTLSFADALVRNESLLAVKLPHVLGHRVLQEVERLMKRNWMRKNRVDEQRAQRIMERYEKEQHAAALAQQWKSTQPQARPLPPASGFMLEQWTDKDLAPILMNLEILSKKQQMLKQRQRCPAFLDDDDGANNFLKASPLASVASRVPPLLKVPSISSPRKGGRGGGGGVTTMQSSREKSGWGSARQAASSAASLSANIPKLPPLSSGRKCW